MKRVLLAGFAPVAVLIAALSPLSGARAQGSLLVPDPSGTPIVTPNPVNPYDIPAPPPPPPTPPPPSSAPTTSPSPSPSDSFHQ